MSTLINSGIFLLGDMHGVCILYSMTIQIAIIFLSCNIVRVIRNNMQRCDFLIPVLYKCYVNRVVL